MCQARAGSRELGPRDQMWALPPGAPALGVGQERRSRPCGQLISVLISQAPGKGWAHDGPPGSRAWGVSGAALSGSRLGAAARPRALLSACPRVAWSLSTSQACGGAPDPCGPDLCAAAMGYFLYKQDGCEKTNKPPEPRLGGPGCQRPPPAQTHTGGLGTGFPPAHSAPRCPGPPVAGLGSTFPRAPWRGTHPGKGHSEVALPGDRPPSPSQGGNALCGTETAW